MLPLGGPQRIVAKGIAAVAVLRRGGEVVGRLVINPGQRATVGAIKGTGKAHERCQVEKHLLTRIASDSMHENHELL